MPVWGLESSHIPWKYSESGTEPWLGCAAMYRGSVAQEGGSPEVDAAGDETLGVVTAFWGALTGELLCRGGRG